MAGKKGRSGRHPKGIAHHIRYGTYRPDRHGPIPEGFVLDDEDESPPAPRLLQMPAPAVQPVQEKPVSKTLGPDDCPAVLTEAGRAVWCGLVNGRLIDVVHAQALPEALPERGDEASALIINRAMEAVIRQCPRQYLWGYHRYKQPRQQESA